MRARDFLVARSVHRPRQVHAGDNKDGIADLPLPVGVCTLRVSPRVLAPKAYGCGGPMALEVTSPERLCVARGLMAAVLSQGLGCSPYRRWAASGRGIHRDLWDTERWAGAPVFPGTPLPS